MAEGDRTRRPGKRIRTRLPDLSFQNPYPYMSEPEAMVHLELEHRHVPFSWRFFDADSAQLKELMPDWSPEFTLREYHIAILVIGNFFGTLPSVVDKNALGKVLLESEGWTVAVLYENDIRAGAGKLLDKELPALRNPAVVGEQRPNPYGIPQFMAARRAQLAGLALARRKFVRGDDSTDRSTQDDSGRGRSRLRRRARRGADTGS